MIKNLWKNYSLSIVLAVLFLFSWIAQGYTQWHDFIQTQQAHRQPAAFSEFIPEFLASTFENWQSEFLQLLTFVVLTSFLYHKGSHESKDSDEEMQAALKRIERKLNTINKK